MFSRLALSILLFAQFIAAVNIIYDETGWTKLDWHKYKIEYNPVFEPTPADEVVKSLDIRKALANSRINSLDGPLERTATAKTPGLWVSDDGALVQSPDEDSVDAAAEAMTCTICHGLVSHVWQHVVAAVNTAEPMNEATVGDMIEEACEEAHAPDKVLQKYRIVKVDAPEAGVSLFVVRARPGGLQTGAKLSIADSSSSSSKERSPASKEGAASKLLGRHPITGAEQAATVKSCKDLVNHHQALLLKPIWKQANDYFVTRRNLLRRLLSKIAADAADVDEYDDPPSDEEDERLERSALAHLPENKLLPYESLCLDMELLCPLWASLGECAANPKYMVGTSRKLGHCRASCGKCKPDNSWRDHPIAKKELAAAASTQLNVLRSTACTTSKACMSGGGSTTPTVAAVMQNADILPGAALAKMDGFVLGKPFWGTPDIEDDSKPSRLGAKPAKASKAASSGGAADPIAADPADKALMSEGLASKFVSIPGMDGFFVYQLHFKTRVYQYHKDGASGEITEEHVLGVYDPKATAAAEKRDAAAAISDAGRAWQEYQKHLAELQATLADAVAAGAAAAAARSSAVRDKKVAGQASDKNPAQEHTPDQAAAAAAAGPGKAEAGSLEDKSAAVGKKADGKGSKKEDKQRKGSAAAGSAAGDGGSSSSRQADSKPPPMLDLLDYLPDTALMVKSWWPYLRHLYTGGEVCAGEGGGRARQVELRVACSPHTTPRLLVREPEFCRYVMVLFHPALCQLPRYKPVPKTPPTPLTAVKGVTGATAAATDGRSSKKADNGATAAATAVQGTAEAVAATADKGATGATGASSSSSKKSKEEGKFGDKLPSS